MGTFTENFREIRERRGYSLNRLQHVTGISRATLSKYQAGLVSPRLNMLIAIADALHVSLDELTGYAAKPSFEERFCR